MGLSQHKTPVTALPKLNALRVIIVLMIAFGYASTMPIGPESAPGIPNPELLRFLGYDPSWIGLALLFFLSGFLAMRSLDRHGSSVKYLKSRVLRNAPLLLFVTTIVIAIIYPLFGSSQGSTLDTLKSITLYFFGTITCIKPGEPLPGLLDDAKYMCLIQGAIWTLKWGVLAHIAVAIGNQLNMFAHRITLLCLSTLSIVFYIIAVQVHLGIQNIPGDIILAAQLAWPFLTGMAVYAYWDEIPDSASKNIMITAGLFGGAALLYILSVPYAVLPWTKAVVVVHVMAWSWLSITVLKLNTEQFKIMNNWPALALAIYLINWPVSQILLYMFSDPGQWGLVSISLPITLVLAWCAHKLVSEPSFNYARSRMYQMSAA